MHRIAATAFMLGLSCSATAPAQHSVPDASFRNRTLAPERRAAELVSRLTLEEKAAQIKDRAPAIERLGIPAYNWWSEGLHGVARAGNATVFPQAIGLSAAWDTHLVRKVADVTATEFRAKYLASRAPDGSSERYRGLTVWSPNVNIFRDPRWGRGQETFGEDPYLSARMGVSFIRGLQGEDPAHPKTIATVKHFVVHSGPEADRHKDDIHPSPHDLEDTYLPAFRAAVVEAKAQGLMCAYNAVDGIPACAMPLLRSRVRDAWGFGGHIVSDCAAIADFFSETGHRFSRSPEEAVAAAIGAGTDLFCAEFGRGRSTDPHVIVNAVRQGLLDPALLDRAVTRLFEARFRLGLLDPPAAGAYAAIAATDVDQPSQRAVSLDAARASMVLLKNDGLLPIRGTPRRIAVIGPNADSVDALVGNYNGTPSQPVTVLKGLRNRYPGAGITYVEGTGLIGPPMADVPGAALCVDRACTRRGIRVEEFAGPGLAGQPVRRAEENAVRFGWESPLRQERASSIRWSGFLTADETGSYRFRLSSDHGYRIRIDGRTVVDSWDAADPSTIQDGEIALERGRRYEIVVEAIQAGARGDQFLQWSNFGSRIEAAVRAARDADLVVFVGGLTAKLEGEEMRVHAPGFDGGDRTSLDLPAPQQALIEQLHATGKPLVLVLMNGSALSVNWADRHVPAIVEAWYPGGEGGRAVAELIAGDYSPAGRLPITFYRGVDQLPAFKDYAMSGRTYRYFTGDPLYAFGHGLSYTRFAYARPVVAQPRIRAGQTAQVSVRVTNTGGREGDEVVQLYGSSQSAGAPIRALMGFSRIRLRPGESRDVRFDIDPRTMSVVDRTGARIVPAGAIDLWIGGGQPSAPGARTSVPGVSARVVVSGSRRLPR